MQLTTGRNIDFTRITFYPMEQMYAIGIWYKNGAVEVLPKWFNTSVEAKEYVNKNLTVYAT